MVCAVSAIVIFPRVRRTEFSVDEPEWISSGYYYTRLLQKRDFEWQKWDCPECGAWGSLNPHLGKWLIGTALVMNSRTRVQPHLRYYNFDATWEENIRAGVIPPLETLVCARSAPALFGVLCCLMVFAIGFWTYNLWVGLIATSFLLTNSVFLKLASQAMTDTFYNFFLLSCCLATVLLWKAAGRKRVYTLVSLCGLFTGLAYSVKISGIVVGSSLFLLVAALSRFVRRSGERKGPPILTIFSLWTLFTVYVLNPFFWPSWQDIRINAVFGEVRSLFAEMVASKGIPAGFDRGRYPQLINLSHVLQFPHSFQRFARELQMQADLGRGNWPPGNHLVTVHKELLWQLSQPGTVLSENLILTYAVGFIATILMGLGMLFVLPKSQRAVSYERDGSHIVPLLYLVVNYLLIVLFMKDNYDRYYLPTVIAVYLISAVGLYGVVERTLLLFHATFGLGKRVV